MDDLKLLLTTTTGRIGRQRWWIGTLAIIVISIIAGIVINIISFGSATVVAWLGVLLNLVMIYPSYCIGIKRRHDRDNDGKDLVALIAASVVVNLLTALGLDGFIMTVIQIAMLVFAIYMIVQLGVLKGTEGPNSYGPDPLQG